MSKLELILLLYATAETVALIAANVAWIKEDEGTLAAVMGGIACLCMSAFIFAASVAASHALVRLW